MKLYGKVVQGLGLGTKLGYPTANLECGDVELPAPGVYAARATVDGTAHNAALIIGARITKGKPLMEVHLLDFSGDLRDQELEVALLEKVSDIEKCESETELKYKIENDFKKVRLCLQALFPSPGVL